ncbi:prenyltransferase [Picrophilus oshimae]|uniref:Prenyltransferase n=1 Tax=Picrophilus torridus (strain ATCC 700027 / DSM 9790 / JCM 10055 / NBRC 100828 / KAW 2/3) TaxID=1122961 RepID=Q6L2T0_PICTO|nr:prenyltransferase [Picrophilus oshimae]AAT42722.1 prenyltransferase [Picrophilus oshimae DSM 9789]
MKIMDLIRGLKIPLYFTSVSPVIIAFSFDHYKKLYLFIIMVLIVLFMQAALNLSMDYYDYKNGKKLYNDDTLFPVGPYLIIKNHVNPKIIRYFFIITMLIAVSLGIYLLVITEKYYLIIIGIIAVIVSLLYVLPPVMLDNRGLGEISTFLSFGPLVYTGAVIVFNLNVDVFVLITGIFTGLMASAIRFLHHSIEDKPNGTRVTHFKEIYSLMLIPAFVITVYKLYLFVFLVPAFIIAIIHIIYIHGDPFKITRKTNEIVFIDIISTLLFVIYLTF